MRAVGQQVGQAPCRGVLPAGQVVGVLGAEQVGAAGGAEQQRAAGEDPFGPARTGQDVGQVMEGVPRGGHAPQDQRVGGGDLVSAGDARPVEPDVLVGGEQVGRTGRLGQRQTA
ncbi:hypothetical protein LUW74_05635 [Actinomadura madurae]|uniref:hypothetical protein n=1 Tax=Actinomadura madurae TaxID=1993 RepID=UPI00202681FD|nr:hypothetical protein [Actinomadura madurae]URN02882.1 hypothetical protein LUW74_05635 [Actinomadura madurae]